MSTLYDLVVKSSAIITPGGRVSGQIAVRDERIVAVLGPDDAVEASQIIDAWQRPGHPAASWTRTATSGTPVTTHKEDYVTTGRSPLPPVV